MFVLLLLIGNALMSEASYIFNSKLILADSNEEFGYSNFNCLQNYLCAYSFPDEESNELISVKLSHLKTKKKKFIPDLKKFSQLTVGVFNRNFLNNKNYISGSNLIPLLREESLSFGIIQIKKENLREESTLELFIDIEYMTELRLFIEILEPTSEHLRFFTLCPGFQTSKKPIYNYLYPIGKELKSKHHFGFKEKCESNFEGQNVLYPDKDSLQTRSDCTHLGESFRGEERICAIVFIVNWLNGTLIYELPEGHLLDSRILVIRNTALEYIPPGPYEWISRNSEPYSFLVVLNKVSNTLKIPSPLGQQIESWRFAILMLMPSVFVLNIILTNYKEKNKTMNLKTILYSLLSTNIYLSGALYDQCSPNLVKRLKADRKLVLRILLSLWLLLSSIVLCGAFKGALSSYLTKEMPITTPTNFGELSESQLPIFTTDSHQSHPTGETTSILRDIIDLLISYNQINKADQTTYSKIRTSVILLVETTMGALVSAYQKNINITESVEEKFRNRDGSPHKIPESFALIGFESVTLHFMALMKPFGNVYVIKPIFKDYTISLNIALVASKNKFGKKFLRLYSTLTESGIYGIWTKYRNSLFLKLDKLFINCIFEAKNPEDVFYHDMCGGYNALYNYKNSPTLYNSAPKKALTINSFQSALKNYLIGVAYPSVMLLLENLFYQYQNFKIRKTFNSYLP